MFGSNKKNSYACLDPLGYAWLIELLIELGDIEDSNNVFRQCLDPKHKWHKIMVTKAQLILELTVPAYFIAISTALNYNATELLNKPSNANSEDKMMRYLCGYPQLLNLNKFYPRDNASQQAERAFILISSDQSIKFSHRQYAEKLKEINELATQLNSNIWIPVSQNLENCLYKLAQGSFYIDGKWHDGISIQMPLGYFSQLAFLACSVFVKSKIKTEKCARLPYNTAELAMIISGLINS